MRKLALHTKIIIGLVLGIIWALAGVKLGLQQFTLDWLSPFGDMFISLLKLIALPLVLFSIIKGISDLKDIRQLGSIGIKTLGLYVASTVLAISVGLLLVNVLKPGGILSEDSKIANRLSYELWVAETDGVELKDNKAFLADPKYSGFLDDAKSKLESIRSNDKALSKQNSASNRKDAGPLELLKDLVPNNIFMALTDNKLMLQVIFFALFFGSVLLMIKPDDAQPVQKLINGLNEAFLKMVDVVMKGAPFFVFALMAGKLTEMAQDDLDKIQDFLMALLAYSGVVVFGLAVLVFVIYPLVVSTFVKRISYVSFFKAMREAQILAFTTSSSAATLPVTMECVTENMKVPKKVSSFVLPIGATVNMDGTSLYISIAVVFLAQIHLVDLTLAQQMTIVLTATLASIGASAVPSAGLIMMIMVLQSVGLNPMWISLIFPVDRILDMCRTVVNVTGDATVAAMVSEMNKTASD